MKLREKKINAFGRSIPVIAVILMVLTAGIAGAALVSVYFTVTGTVTVNPALSVVPETYTVTMEQGETATQDIVISNAADVSIDTEITTEILPDVVGITVTYYTGYGTPDQAPLPDADVDGLPEATIPASGSLTITAEIVANPALEPITYTITTGVVPA
ncbi:MAG: hypothetical protein QMC77_08930 [Methanocellales archaeon]|nr:hypothetical protein [Methanocellales archaeon]